MFVNHQFTTFSNAGHANFLQGLQFNQTDVTQTPGFFNGVPGSSFKDVMSGLANDMNQTMEAPNELMKRSLTTGDVDVHEIMIATAKADVAVNVSSQVLTKVIQAYERVQQIQV